MKTVDSILGIHASALQIKSQRAEVIANNIANADTPNFQSKDINFKEALANIQNENTVALSTTNKRHISTNLQQPQVHLVDNPSSQASVDGNTVDSDVEKVRFTKNSTQYQISLNLLSGRIRGLRTAIRGD